MPAPDGPRILVATSEPLTGSGGRSRNSALLPELGRRLPVVGSLRPELAPWQQAAVRLRWVHPAAERRAARTAVNPWSFGLLSARLARDLEGRAGDFDVALVLQTLFRAPRGVRAAIYTDNTAALTARHYPPWLPLGRRARTRQLALEASACRDAAVVLTMSEWARRSVLEDYGCEPERVVAVGAGTNLAGDLPDDREWTRPLVLFVGYDFERKGGPELLEAFALARATVPAAELWIAGPRSGPAAPGVRWLGRLRDPAEVQRTYAAASVFALPSRFDPCPHALREAMAAGLACVTTPTGATAEIVEHDRTGLLVAPRDAQELSRALVELLGDPARAERLARAGHAEVSTRHTWSAVAERMAGPLCATAG